MPNSSLTVEVYVAPRVQVAIARWRELNVECAQDLSRNSEDMIP